MLAALVPALPARGAPPVREEPATGGRPAALPAKTVLARYAVALNAVELPKAVSFEYAVEQAGTHQLLQRHRIYRSGDLERDETLAVDGEQLPYAIIRVFNGRRDRYAITRIAPRQTDYDFRLVATARSGKHVDYVFRTTPKSAAAYTVERVRIDGVHFLPVTVDFSTAQNGVQAHGSISYAKAEQYWVPVAALAVATIGGEPARETLAWSHYDFPASLPPSTFIAPRPFVTPTVEPLLH